MSLDIKYNHPGELLKEKRLSKNLSLRGLSIKTGISHTEISKVENGQRSNPSYNTILNICRALDLDFNHIAGLFNIDTLIKDEENIDPISHIDRFINRRALQKEYSIAFLEKYCYELSEKYNICISPNMFKERYRVGNRSTIPYLCFTKNDMVIGVDVKFISSRMITPQILHSIKSSFADFYFNFRNSFYDSNMIYGVCLITESDEYYDIAFDKYKEELYKFMPILSTHFYKMDELID